MIHTCRIFSYNNGIFRIVLNNKDETKYKNKTNIGENIELKSFSNFIEKEDRLILETIEDEEMKLNMEVNLANLGHEYIHKAKKTYRLEIFIYPDFIINYYNEDKLISTLNAKKKLTILNGKNFNPNSIDFKVYNIKSCHGLPERLSPFELKDEAYRLYNLDVFEQVIGHPKSLYGSIPMMHHVSDSGDYMFTIFVNNSSETWVELETTSGNEKSSTWTTEGGLLDIYLFSDVNFKKIFYKVAKITGFAPLPPLFSLGYHHCRWGFLSQEDITEVDEQMTYHGIPYDVLWLDIDHTYKKHYFTWDKVNFPDMESFVNKLKEKGRHLVTIIDPHLSTNKEYEISQTLKCLVSKNNSSQIKSFESYKQENAPVKKQEEKENDDLIEIKEEKIITKEIESSHFVGHCWPGASFYADFINYEQILPIWNKFFKNEDYFLNSDIIHTWIDMNEPSVFNQFEITMPKDCLHFDGEKTVPHYEVHNIYGHNYHRVTYDSLKKRYQEKIRPFVLSRSFFAGSQQYGFIWTGDNKSTWEFMKISIDMLLSTSMCGLSACGADVGGFFGDPSEDLLVAWYQLGAFYPFFRGHSHNETKRREPWNFSNNTLESITKFIKLRYNFLLYFYTKFFEHTLTGIPICKPLWLELSNHKFYGDIENYSNMMIGDELIVIPYLNGKEEFKLNFQESRFYDAFDGTLLNEKKMEFLLEENYKDKKLTLLAVGGSVLFITTEIGNSSNSVLENPITILVYLDKGNFASGNLYFDDGKSFNYQNGDFIYMNYTFKKNQLIVKSNKFSESPLSFKPVEINCIIISGYGYNDVKEKVKSVKLSIENKESIDIDFFHGTSVELDYMKKYNLQISTEFSLTFEF